MRRRVVVTTVTCLVAAVLTPVTGPATAAPADPLAEGIRQQFAAGIQVVPKNSAAAKAVAAPANPYTSLVADPATVDRYYWDQVVRQQGANRAKVQASMTSLAVPPLIHDEAEPAGVFGSNDTHATAELVNGLGTGANENNRSRVLGQHSPEAVSTTTLAAFAEDDGAIPFAGDPLVAVRAAQRAHQQPDRQRTARQHRHRQRRLRLREAHRHRRPESHGRHRHPEPVRWTRSWRSTTRPAPGWRPTTTRAGRWTACCSCPSRPPAPTTS